MSYASLTQRANPVIDLRGVREAMGVGAAAVGAFMGCAGVAAALWVIVAVPGVLG